MASTKTQIIRGLLGLVVVVVLAASCSSGETSEPAPATSDTAESDTAESDAAGASSNVGDASAEEDETGGDSDADAAPATEATARPTAGPTLNDEDLASVQDLQPGEQVEDAQGNLIAIYGVAVWPESFEELSDSTQSEFPFFGDVQAVTDPSSQLVVLDVGMCAAGLDAGGFGTAEFFVHEAANEALSTDPTMGRGVLARHPVARPGFDFPSPAECARGFLPVLWSSDRPPAVARYVLATRSNASATVEQHVYQWDLDSVALADSDDAGVIEPQFTAGQTVTFNQGRLQDTTVTFDGWAELIGTESPLDGTRLIAVSLEYCPSSTLLPEFGIGVDNWNIVSPLGEVALGADPTQDPTTACFDGWLEFAIPFGSVPTAFFASDGINTEIGYAEWSLIDAALAAPQP